MNADFKQDLASKEGSPEIIILREVRLDFTTVVGNCLW